MKAPISIEIHKGTTFIKWNGILIAEPPIQDPAKDVTARELACAVNSQEPLLNAAQVVLTACLSADARGELDGEIDGSYLDQLHGAILNAKGGR